MDIRKFLKRKDPNDECSSTSSIGASSSPERTSRCRGHTSASEALVESYSASVSPTSCFTSDSSETALVSPPQNDIGLYVNQSRTKNLSTDQKYDLLTNYFKPSNAYNFQQDKPANSNRCFRHQWLSDYAPWLAYSPKLKGALCIYCVIFPQPVRRGIQGGFITTAFTKYKNFNQQAKKHIASEWHRGSQQDAANFVSLQNNLRRDVVSQI